MYVEFASAIEDAGGKLLSPDTLNEVQDMRELLAVVERVDKSKRIEAPEIESKSNVADEIYVPGILKRIGNVAIDLVGEALYNQVLKDDHRRSGKCSAAHQFHRCPESRIAS